MNTLEKKPLGFNQYWADFIVAELVRGGVRNFFVSPGNRSAALATAVAENPAAEALVHFDERGAAFAALGAAKASGQPSVLICTSGTAAANYLPAVIEASESLLPLIILSADRPVEKRDARSHQTIDQTRLFGRYARWFFDLQSPSAEIEPEFVLSILSQAVWRASAAPRGPVHINCQFREPLLDRIDDKRQESARLEKWRLSSDPFTRYAAAQLSLPEGECKRLSALLERAKRGLIVCGQLASETDRRCVSDLAQAWKWPVLADALSGLRRDDCLSDQLCAAHYDLYLSSERIWAEINPDCILHFGETPTSKQFIKRIERFEGNYILVNAHPYRQDEFSRVTQSVAVAPHVFCRALVDRISSRSAITDAVSRFDSAAAEAIGTLANDGASQLSEWQALRAASLAAPQESVFFLSNSLAVRQADWVLPKAASKLRCFANRGVSGIDGITASAFGAALALKQPLTLAIGDLAFLHDLNSLALISRLDSAVAILLLNNNGGAIFSRLPNTAASPHFEQFFAAPHNLAHISPAADLFGLEYFCVMSVSDLDQRLSAIYRGGRKAIIEINCTRAATQQALQKLEIETLKMVESSLNQSF